MEQNLEYIIALYCCPFENCLKEYKSKFNLRRHVQYYHTGSKPFVCSLCQRSFVSKQNLLEHRFIHSGIKPYKCNNCGKRFRQLSLLSLHKRSHEDNYEETLSFVMNLQEK